MDDRTIFLHIGFHKTASSTVQFGLTGNRRRLKQLGWLYPTSGIVYQVAHHNIVFELRNDHRYEPDAGDFQDLIDEISQFQGNVIISSEDFCFCDDNEIQTVYNRLSPLGELKVIVYIRRQDKWLQSRWAQIVKTGNFLGSYADSLAEHLDEGDFYHRLQPWAAVVGKENVKVGVLERNQLQGGHVLFDFLSICGVKEFDDFTLPENKNISPSLKTLEVIRYFMSQTKPQLTRDEKNRLAWLLQKYTDTAEWNEGEPVNLVTRDLYEHVMGYFAESNRKLAQEYLGRDELFLEPFVEKPITTYDLTTDLSGKEALDLMVEVWMSMLQTIRNENRQLMKLVEQSDNPNSQIDKSPDASPFIRSASQQKFGDLVETVRTNEPRSLVQKALRWLKRRLS